VELFCGDWFRRWVLFFAHPDLEWAEPLKGTARIELIAHCSPCSALGDKGARLSAHCVQGPPMRNQREMRILWPVPRTAKTFLSNQRQQPERFRIVSHENGTLPRQPQDPPSKNPATCVA